MRYRGGFVVSAMLVCCLLANGKDKKKALLPADVLRAQTVAVMVDPDAGVDMQDPDANRIASENVEQALENWGWLNPVPPGTKADLIIVVRKGNGNAVQPTIGGTRPNGFPPMGGQSPGGPTQIGGPLGNGPMRDPSDPQSGGANTQYPSNGRPMSPGPHPQMDVGSTNDVFTVYRSGPDALDAPPVWRYTAKGALDAPDVPAVKAFRKLVAESEKQLAKKP